MSGGATDSVDHEGSAVGNGCAPHATTLLRAQIRFSWRGGIPVSGPWAALHWHSNCQYITCIDLIRGVEIGQSGRWFPTPGGLLRPRRTQTTSRHRGLRSSGECLFVHRTRAY
jgi:hypothetical protein